MPRNRYTKLVRKCEHAQLDRQEKKLTALIHALRHGITEPVEQPFVIGAKERRSARLEQKRRHKPTRTDATADISQQQRQPELGTGTAADPIEPSATPETRIA